MGYPPPWVCHNLIHFYTWKPVFQSLPYILVHGYARIWLILHTKSGVQESLVSYHIMYLSVGTCHNLIYFWRVKASVQGAGEYPSLVISSCVGVSLIITHQKPGVERVPSLTICPSAWVCHNLIFHTQKPVERALVLPYPSAWEYHN